MVPKLQNPLAATVLSEAQCHEIMKWVLQIGLPAMGIIWHFPRAVSYGPLAKPCLSIPNVYTEI